MEKGMKQVTDDKRNLSDLTTSTESNYIAAQVSRVAGSGVWPALSWHVVQKFTLPTLRRRNPWRTGTCSFKVQLDIEAAVGGSCLRSEFCACVRIVWKGFAANSGVARIMGMRVRSTCLEERAA